VSSKEVILLIDDDRKSIDYITKGLHDSFDVRAIRGPTTHDEIRDTIYYGPTPNAIVLGLTTMGLRPAELLREIRKLSASLPLLFLVDPFPPVALLPVLSMEKTDFILRPIDAEELGLRIRLLIQSRGEDHPQILEFGGIRMDRHRHEVRVNGSTLALTRLEYRILEQLLAEPEGVRTRDGLLREVWGMDFDPGTNVVDVHISNLRKKLRPRRPSASIMTVRGVGFRLTEEVAAKKEAATN